MTIQEKKLVLNKCKELNDDINKDIEQLARLKSLAVKTTPTLSLMPKATSGDDRLQSTCEKIELQQWKINHKTDSLIDLKKSIMADIEMSVNDEILKALLKYKYIYLLNFKDTAYRLNIKETTARKKKCVQALKQIVISEKTQYIAKTLDRGHKM